MARYQIITLVDITRTSVDRASSDQLKISQQANFNSLVQSIGLRSNVTWNRDPERCTGRMPEPADGKAVHWIWEFEVEREDVFLKNGDQTGLLIEDLNNVPVIVGLTEDADLTPAAFQTINGNRNTWVKII